MGRKSLILTMVLASIALPFASSARALGGTTIEGFAGAGMPLGDFADEHRADAQPGMQFGGAVTFWLNSMFGLGVDGSFVSNTSGAEGETIDVGGGVTYTLDEDRFKTFQVGVHGKYAFPMQGKMKVHGLLGLGVYNMKEKLTETFTSGGISVSADDEFDFKSRLGGKLGLGARLALNETWDLGADVDYNTITEDEEETGVLTLSYVGLKAVVGYNLPTTK